MFESFANQWLLAGLAAGVTVVATCWSHVRNFCQQIAGRVIVTVTVSGYQAEAMRLYLKSRFAPSRFGPRAYLGWMLYVRPRRRVQLVPMEVSPPAGRMYWQGWRPVWTYKSKQNEDDLDTGANSRDYNAEGLTLAFLRGTFDADRLVVDAATWFNEQVVVNCETDGRRHYIKHVFGTAGKMVGPSPEREHRSSHVTVPSSSTDIRGCMQYRPLGWSFSQLGPEQPQPGTAVDQLALSSDALAIVAEARHWKESEDWYKSRGIPWRRGWLLHGPPGTGKTALARAVAEDLDLPVFVFDLASLHNDELLQEWARMLAEVPCMALIEDVDAVFDHRCNVSSRDRQNLTFDCLLNCLDGIERSDGLFVVVTTNRIEKVDSALGLPDEHTGSTRPGRIDRVLETSPLTDAGRRKIARRIVAEWPDQWEELVAEGDGDTGAQFQERCARRALELHYGEEVPPRQTLRSAEPQSNRRPARRLPEVVAG